jgi:hypothetical protein
MLDRPDPALDLAVDEVPLADKHCSPVPPCPTGG